MRVSFGVMLAATVVLPASLVAQVITGEATGEKKTFVEARGNVMPVPLPPGGPAPRMTDGKVDLSGVWFEGPTGKANAWSVVPDARVQEDPVPFQPWADAKIKGMTRTEIELSRANVRCEPVGTPGMFNQNPYPHQIVMKPGMFLHLVENNNNWRLVDTTGRPHKPKEELEPLFNGDQTAHWEGDTLVIDTISLDERTLIASSGWFHSDQVHVIERIRRPSRNYLEYQYTVEDPKVLTRPWTSAWKTFSLGNEYLIENFCTNNENAEQLRKLIDIEAGNGVQAQAPAAAQAVDWGTLRPEILRHYRALVQIDTTAGRETLAVEYLKKVLEAEGIPTSTFALDPARANLVARIKGNGSKRPILILAHTDVVGVQREKWPVDPFGAVEKDGYIWGRGSKDDKPVLAANLITMLMLKRLGVQLDRDVIFLAESGEEADTTGVGINFMVREHFAEIDAEFAMTEGGGARTEGGRVTRVNIGTAEKLPARARLVATGTAGHGSVPRLDNALIHLAAAIDKVGRWQTPMRLNETTRAYFEKLASISPPERAAIYKSLLGAPAAAAGAQTYLREHSPGEYSMLRTSVVPTILKAGVGANVIPSEAEATLDIRALPGEDIEKFYAEMAKVIDDPAVKIVPIPPARPPSPASRLDTDMYRVMERVARTIYGGATVIPSMSTGASDQAQLRAKGIQSYGIGPATTEFEDINYPAHGDVERLAESSLYPFVQYVWEVVTEVAARK